MSIDLHKTPISRHNLEFKLGSTTLKVDALALTITKKINCHTKVAFSLPVGELGANQKQHAYLDELLDNSTIELNLVNLPTAQNNHSQNQQKQPEHLFVGMITQLKLEVISKRYVLTGEALSNTYKMDIQKRKHTFQNVAMPYNQLLSVVTKEYGAKVYQSRVADAQKLEKLAVQYDETDWEFLKRMASYLGLGVVPLEKTPQEWFTFGVPECKETYSLPVSCLHDYEIIRDIGEYQRLTENQCISDLPEQNVQCYRFNALQHYLEIGDAVKIPETGKTADEQPKDQTNNNDKKNNAKKWVVKEVAAVLEAGSFSYSYLVIPEAGLKLPFRKHPVIAGVSLEGKVIAVAHDKVKVHFVDLDQDQTADQAVWFPYTTAYASENETGWYCMPEKNDFVKVFFPNATESEAIATGSIRKQSSGKNVKLDLAYAKYLRTAQGKEIVFSNNEIVIAGYGQAEGEKPIVAIQMNEETGIAIRSTNSQVTIYSQGDLKVSSANNLKIEAANSINLCCNGNSVEMNGSTYLKGLTKNN